MRQLPSRLTAKQRALVNQLKGMGISPSDDDFWAVWDEENEEHSTGMQVSEEAELVLRFVERPGQYEVQCKHCKRKYITNYLSNKYCSDQCRAEALDAIGIVWDPEKSPQERWAGKPPSVINPETLEVLKKWAQSLLDYSSPSNTSSQPSPITVTDMPVKDDGAAETLPSYVRELIEQERAKIQRVNELMDKLEAQSDADGDEYVVFPIHHNRPELDDEFGLNEFLSGL